METNPDEWGNMKDVSINDLLECDCSFYIPHYQRGYRWLKKHVHAFLDDVYELEELRKLEELRNPQKERTSSIKQWNCIQPLVVKNRSIKTPNGVIKAYEVIDGQQRLTTIKKILETLENGKYYDLWYQNGQEIQKKGSEMDEFFKGRVGNAVDNWINKKLKDEPELNIEKLKNILITDLKKNTRFLWQKVNPQGDHIKEDSTESFTRLNISRVPLESSDLIKALLLREHQYDDASNTKATDMRAEIAVLWSEIEDAISDDRFWLMFNKTSNVQSSRMQQLFHLAYQTIYDKSGADGAETVFQYYENLIKKGDKKLNLGKNELKTTRYVWDSFVKIYNIVREWYDDIDIYHYVGVFCTVSDASLVTLLKIWNNGNNDKKSFITNILKRIKKTKQFSYKGEIYDDGEAPLKIEDLHYPDNDGPIRHALLIHNVSTVMQQNKLPKRDRNNNENNQDREVLLKNMGNRFPFHMYRKCKWHLEHVYSQEQESKDLEYCDEGIKCLAHAIIDIKTSDAKQQLEAMINDFFDTDKDTESMKEKYYAIINKADDLDLVPRISDDKRNSIKNLVLLDETTNCGYKNDPFFKKRRRIIDSWLGMIEMNNYACILPCTLSVFTKAYTPKPKHILCWDANDADSYLEDLNLKIRMFFER